MGRRAAIGAVCLALTCVALASLTACGRGAPLVAAPAPAASAPASAAALVPDGGEPVRVLFVGNSYTLRNGGLDAQLERLDPSIEASHVAFEGFTLRDHWNDGTALRAIRSGRWDVVVLQEQSTGPVLSPLEFQRYGQFFDAEIREAGAHSALLTTWEHPGGVHPQVTTAALSSAYDRLGGLTGARVIPVGTAFAASLAQRPDLPLTLEDGHPTANGTYLAGCVVYGALMARSPVGAVAADATISADAQAYFQRIAAGALGY